MKTKLLIALFFVSSIAFCQGGKGLLMAQEYPELTGWEANSMITNGITGDFGNYINLAVVVYNQATYLIIHANSAPSLYKWNESLKEWESSTGELYDRNNSTGVYDRVCNTIFGLEGDLYYLLGNQNGDLYSYYWNVTDDEWSPISSSTSNVITTLADVSTPGTLATPNVFRYKKEHYLMLGFANGNTYMYKWDSINEEWDSFTSGDLDDLGSYTNPCGFTVNDKCYVIVGEMDAVYGYQFDGSIMIPNSTIVSGVDVSGSSRFAPNVFRLNGKLYMLVGNVDGTIDGYVQITN